MRGQSVRISDIDTPETYQAQCTHEAELGQRATRRLLALLNMGPFTMERRGFRDSDQYSRRLRVIVRDGRSLGGILVSEGLAKNGRGNANPGAQPDGPDRSRFAGKFRSSCPPLHKEQRRLSCTARSGRPILSLFRHAIGQGGDV